MVNIAFKRLVSAGVVALALSTPVPIVWGAQSSQVIVGFVTNASDGTAIPGAKLSVAASGTPSKNAVVSATANEFGSFELSTTGVRGILTISAPGYATSRIRWPLRGSGVPVELKMEKGAKLTVHVRNDKGALVPAILSISTEHPGNYISVAARAVSGIVQLSELASGRTTILVRAEGLAPEAATLQVDAGQNYGPIEVVLHAGGTLNGLVVDSSGVPVPGALIVATYDPEVRMARLFSNFLPAGLRTDGKGGFTIKNIFPGALVHVSAKSEDRTFSATTTRTISGVETNVTLLLQGRD